MPTIFITGTDTDCGKTHVSVALVHALRKAGKSVAAYKPVAAGCVVEPDGSLRNSDALQLMAAAGGGFDYAQINPLALEPPIAPHLAAADAKIKIETAKLTAGAERLAQAREWLIIEGAGGFLVPLNDTETFADWIAATQWPVILVVGMRLGCINHALLSVAEIQRRSRLLGWVANVLPPEQPRLLDNIASLSARIAAPCLGVVRSADSEHAAAELDLASIVGNFENLSH